MFISNCVTQGTIFVNCWDTPGCKRESGWSKSVSLCAVGQASVCVLATQDWFVKEICVHLHSVRCIAFAAIKTHTWAEVLLFYRTTTKSPTVLARGCSYYVILKNACLSLQQRAHTPHAACSCYKRVKILFIRNATNSTHAAGYSSRHNVNAAAWIIHAVRARERPPPSKVSDPISGAKT